MSTKSFNNWLRDRFITQQITDRANLFRFKHPKQHWEPIIWATSWVNLFMPYANNKGTDQPVHARSLISTFVVRCLDSIISLVFIFPISWFSLASELSRPVWVLPGHKPRRQVFLWRGSYVLYRFSRDEAHMSFIVSQSFNLCTPFELVTRKPVFGDCDQVGPKPACAATEAR